MACHITTSFSVVTSLPTASLHHHFIKTHFPNPTSKQQQLLSLKISPTSHSHIKTSASDSDTSHTTASQSSELDCVGTGTDVECVYVSSDGNAGDYEITEPETTSSLVDLIWEWTLLVSPFFFWVTAMVAMQEILPITGPLFVSSFRLIPSGLLLVAFASSRGKKIPSGFNAWLSIALFALV